MISEILEDFERDIAYFATDDGLKCWSTPPMMCKGFQWEGEDLVRENGENDRGSLVIKLGVWLILNEKKSGGQIWKMQKYCDQFCKFPQSWQIQTRKHHLHYPSASCNLSS